jgi:hypothetical protein
MSTHYVEDTKNWVAHRRKFCMTVRTKQKTQYHQCTLTGDTNVSPERMSNTHCTTRYWLFRDIRQQRFVASYRRLGTTTNLGSRSGQEVSRNVDN